MTYIERCLYDYKANKALLEFLITEQESLMSMHGANYSLFDTNNVSDPVSEVAHRALELEKKIKNVEKQINSVDRLYADLCGSAFYMHQMREILRLKYFEHHDKNVIKEALSISNSTLWRRTHELLRLAKKYFGG